MGDFSNWRATVKYDLTNGSSVIDSKTMYYSGVHGGTLSVRDTSNEYVGCSGGGTNVALTVGVSAVVATGTVALPTSTAKATSNSPSNCGRYSRQMINIGFVSLEVYR